MFTVNIGQKNPAQLTTHLDPPLFIEAAPYQHWLFEPFDLACTSQSMLVRSGYLQIQLVYALPQYMHSTTKETGHVVKVAIVADQVNANVVCLLGVPTRFVDNCDVTIGDYEIALM